MIFLLFCLLNAFCIHLYFTKKYHFFIFSSLMVLIAEPIFQKLLDDSLKGDTFSVFGFDRVQTNLIIIATNIFILLNAKKSDLGLKLKSGLFQFSMITISFHIINVILSENIQNSIVVATVAILGPILYFYVLLSIPKDKFVDTTMILKIIYVANILFLLIGLLYYNNTLSKDESSSSDIIRTGGGLWLSNIATQILAIFFPYIFSKTNFKNSSLLKFLTALLYVVLLIISMSRTGLIVYFIMLIVIFWNSKRKLGYVILGLVIFNATVFVSTQIFKLDVVKLYTERFLEQGDAVSTTTSDSRFEIWQECTEIIKGHEILGTGISSFVDINSNKFSNAHNIFINILVERGIVGFVLFLFFVIFIFSVISQSIKIFQKSEAEIEFANYFRIGFLGFISIGLTGNDMFINSGFVNGWATYFILFLLAVLLKKTSNYKINS